MRSCHPGGVDDLDYLLLEWLDEGRSLGPTRIAHYSPERVQLVLASFQAGERPLVWCPAPGAYALTAAGREHLATLDAAAGVAAASHADLLDLFNLDDGELWVPDDDPGQFWRVIATVLIAVVVLLGMALVVTAGWWLVGSLL